MAFNLHQVFLLARGETLKNQMCQKFSSFCSSPTPDKVEMVLISCLSVNAVKATLNLKLKSRLEEGN